ncbi:hypothetical protein CsSME_00025909 [Camellia sinensis var. sinensis]
MSSEVSSNELAVDPTYSDVMLWSWLTAAHWAFELNNNVEHFCFVSSYVMLKCGRKGGRDKSEKLSTQFDAELQGVNNVNLYTYKELRTATDDFSHANKIGEGGFGSVYKGRLKNGNIAAIKVLSPESRQGVKDTKT